jgi:GntR family transcriptional regulator
MIDIQHDSPVPIHEQITSQLMAHVAAGTLAAGARLADSRAFAQQLLTNPQATARAYAELEWEGVVKKHPEGGVEVVPGADAICRMRRQDGARQRLREAVRQGQDAGLAAVEIQQVVEQAVAAAPVEPLSPAQLRTSIKKSTYATSHRDSQGIQDLSGEKGAGSP